MKNSKRSWLRVAIVLLAIAVLSGCVPPGAVNESAQVAGTPPSGLAQAYDDAGWEILSDVNGTLAYRIPADQMPDISAGDQVVHNGNELREVVAIIDKTADAIVVHTIDGDLAKLFPSDSTLSIDTSSMTATVEYKTAGRAAASAYSLPVVLKQVRQTNADGTTEILYDSASPNRSITLIDVNNSNSIVNIDKTFTQEIFNVSGSGSKTIGNGSVSYNGSASLILQERVKLAANFNLRLYMNYDAGITWVPHTTTTTWWLFGWHSTTTTWYEAVPWSTLTKDLKATVSGEAFCSAQATLACNGTVTGSYSVPLPFALTYSFAIGVVPVEIGYTPRLSVNAVATGTLNATTGGSFSVSGEFGAKCNNSGWGAINTFSTATSFIKPTLTAAASISVVPKIDNEIRAGIGFANTGVYGTITLSPYLSMTASTGTNAADRTWNVSCGVTGTAGVKASVVGYDLGSYQAQILNYTKVITSGTY